MAEAADETDRARIVKGSPRLRAKVKIIRNADPATHPVALAEAALARLSGEFAAWVDDDVGRLGDAWAAIERGGLTPMRRDALARAAHDLKGQAATLGFPLVSEVCASLVTLLGPDFGPKSLTLAGSHVRAVKAIMRESAGDVTDRVAVTLVERLVEATREARSAAQAAAAGSSPPSAT